MAQPFFGGKFFNGGFFASAADTHDGFDASDLNRKLDGQREERERAAKSHRENLRELLEAAFAPESQAPVAAEIRKVAAPAVKRMESGAIAVDWEALAERQALEARIYALREAFWREQAEIEDDEDALMLTGSLH